MPTGAPVRSIGVSVCEERLMYRSRGAHMQQRGAYEGHSGASIRKKGASKVHKDSLQAKRGRL